MSGVEAREALLRQISSVSPMKNDRKTKRQPDENLAQMRQRIAQLERANAHLEQSNRKLQEAEAKYRILFGEVPLGIAAVTPEGTVLEVNDALCRMTGYSREELVEIDWKLISVDPGCISPLLDLLEKTGCVRDFGTELRRKDGSTFFMSASASQVRLGGRDAILAIGRDMTTLRLADMEARRAYEEMEPRVKERTSELNEANERLRQEIEERKRTQQELQKEKATLTNIIELNPYSISFYDAEGRFLEGNRAFHELFNAPPATKLLLVHRSDPPGPSLRGGDEQAQERRTGPDSRPPIQHPSREQAIAG
jgi:PAS domain S-box-containing protein